MLVADPVELTTAATDLLLGIECIVVAVLLPPGTEQHRFRVTVWIWILSLTAAAALLGALVHGIELSDAVRLRLWMPLYLSLGLVVALFLVAALLDWRGERAALRLLPIALVIGTVFFALTQLSDRGFLLVVGYEAAVMLAALAVYIRIAATLRLPGSGLIAFAIVLNLIGAGLQASEWTLIPIVPVDHNGLFHLVQMIAVAILAVGLGRRLHA